MDFKSFRTTQDFERFIARQPRSVYPLIRRSIKALISPHNSCIVNIRLSAMLSLVS